MEISTAVKTLSALAQDVRLSVFRTLVKAGAQGMPAGKIAEVLEIPSTSLSFHLKELSHAGLVESRREGRQIIYSLQVERMKELLTFLSEDCCAGHPDLCQPISEPAKGKKVNMTEPAPAQLRREIGVLGAMMMGMGSIVGTGVFVSIGIAAEVAGSSVLLAIGLASLVAICNGLSSAQLAANHAVSGGTYEYGYHWLTPRLGFTAGWMFLCAKSASAATAALGFAGYLLHATHVDQQGALLGVALTTLVLLTLVTLMGISRSSMVNMLIVAITMISLTFFVVAGFPNVIATGGTHFGSLFSGVREHPGGFLQATALMFVAYTGYGRIATLGEEVKAPRQTIPRAVIATLLVSMLLYVSVAFVGLGTLGAEAYGEATRQNVAPLQIIASEFGVPGGGLILAVGAMTAMLGVLLNLLLGLSRVLLAMGRRHDMPAGLAKISARTQVPWMATLVVAAIIGGLIFLGDVRLTWSFSAFTVLIYYAITNLCALRLRAVQRLFPIWTAWCGLAACLFLAFWVDWQIWLAGIGLLAVGWTWHAIAQRALHGKS